MRETSRTVTPAVAPTLLDRLIGWASPRAGVERMRARAEMNATLGFGGYVGGKTDRRATRWWRPGNASADADLLPDLPQLRARSRDLARNAPIATGAVATVVTNVVGDGLQLQAAVDRDVLGLSDEEADRWERTAERLWWAWCRSADITGVQCFEELQALALRTVLESGDCLMLRRYRKNAGEVFGTKLQVIEADRLSNPDGTLDRAGLTAGVETDDAGMPIAYHIASRHPGNFSAAPLRWERMPARGAANVLQVLHLYDRLRPEQTRGAPYLAPVIEHLKQLARYSDAEVTAAVISAMYTVFITSPADEGETPIGGETDQAIAENEVKLGEGAIVSLNPGEEINAANPGRPNEKFDPFVQAFLRQVGVALELPFELLIKHFTASYSASRAALEMAWQFFRRRRSWLAGRLCQTAYEWMLEEAIADGRLAAPGFFADPMIRQAWTGAEWIGPARMSLDPLKEANADKIDIETGVKTREQVCLERTGGQWEDKERQLAKEAAQRKADGVQAEAPAVAPAQGRSQDGSPADPDMDQDDDEDQQRQSA